MNHVIFDHVTIHSGGCGGQGGAGAGNGEWGGVCRGVDVDAGTDMETRSGVGCAIGVTARVGVGRFGEREPVGGGSHARRTDENDIVVFFVICEGVGMQGVDRYAIGGGARLA
jgi:hypothetical protein